MVITPWCMDCNTATLHRNFSVSAISVTLSVSVFCFSFPSSFFFVACVFFFSTACFFYLSASIYLDFCSFLRLSVVLLACPFLFLSPFHDKKYIYVAPFLSIRLFMSSYISLFFLPSRFF